MASDLNPSVRCLYLCVPTVIRVVGHFVGPVLSEPDRFCLDAHLSQEEEGPTQEVADRFVFYHALGQGFPDSELEAGIALAGFLVGC